MTSHAKAVVLDLGRPCAGILRMRPQRTVTRFTRNRLVTALGPFLGHLRMAIDTRGCARIGRGERPVLFQSVPPVPPVLTKRCRHQEMSSCEIGGHDENGEYRQSHDLRGYSCSLHGFGRRSPLQHAYHAWKMAKAPRGSACDTIHSICNTAVRAPVIRLGNVARVSACLSRRSTSCHEANRLAVCQKTPHEKQKCESKRNRMRKRERRPDRVVDTRAPFTKEEPTDYGFATALAFMYAMTAATCSSVSLPW